jgi:hypothetical protein
MRSLLETVGDEVTAKRLGTFSTFSDCNLPSSFARFQAGDVLTMHAYVARDGFGSTSLSSPLTIRFGVSCCVPCPHGSEPVVWHITCSCCLPADCACGCGECGNAIVSSRPRWLALCRLPPDFLSSVDSRSCVRCPFCAPKLVLSTHVLQCRCLKDHAELARSGPHWPARRAFKRTNRCFTPVIKVGMIEFSFFCVAAADRPRASCSQPVCKPSGLSTTQTCTRRAAKPTRDAEIGQSSSQRSAAYDLIFTALLRCGLAQRHCVLPGLPEARPALLRLRTGACF